MSSLEAPRVATRRDIALAVAVACLSLAAVWWSTRSSLTALGNSQQIRACPAIYPAPPSCYPAWHIQVAALVTLAVLAVLTGAVIAARWARGRATPAILAVVALAGLLAWWVAADPNRFLPIW
ncbi:hypothetical protein ABT297_36045 [Dactylosporangium sp. NPDC000555]|uniref:hypothetical protein n=1 Tax=Dactylosporangium sp. NPDC000555 TaxID=3154260 RepID=UPI0033297DAC